MKHPTALVAATLTLCACSTLADRAEQSAGGTAGDASNTASVASGVVYFPQADVFSPPVASPKEPRSHLTYQRLHTDFGTVNIGSVGFGDGIGLVRWPVGDAGDAIQLGLGGAVLAQFNLDSDSADLINADYFIGVPLTARFDAVTFRLRTYHQSSHLGDEFLLGDARQPTTRVDLSFETVELLAAYQWHGIEVYAGPSRIVHSHTPLDNTSWQAGFNYLSEPIGLGQARLIGGFHYSAWEETDWDSDVSVKAGIELNPEGLQRKIRILLEYYQGHLPYGQFYQIEGQIVGIGLALAF